MKIKGVMNGKMRGSPIELNDKEKAVEAVKESISKEAPEGWVYYCDSVNVTSSAASSMGPRKDGKTFANNSYVASGDVVYRRLNAATDDLFPAKTQQFKVKFKDILDGFGMPDIEITEFKLEG